MLCTVPRIHIIDVHCSYLVQFGADSPNNFIIIERCTSDLAEELAGDKNVGKPHPPMTE